jgi:uncharacterized membrane protein YhaH (DUF805 family)
MILDLFGFQGRIGRFGWWMTQLFFLVTGVAYNLLLVGPPPELSITEPKTARDLAIVIAEVTSSYFQDPLAVGMQVLNNWFFVTTTVQRLHDRGKPGWRVLFAYVPLALLGYAVYVFTVPQDFTTGLAFLSVGFAGLALASLWLIIECGMLRGEDGDNEYGPPPGTEEHRKAFAEELSAMGDRYARSNGEENEVQRAPVRQPALAGAASGRLFGSR